jgi:hypothetical protein
LVKPNDLEASAFTSDGVCIDCPNIPFNDTIELTPLESEPGRAYGYRYSIEEVFLSTKCALDGATGFRPVARILSILGEKINFSPAFSTIRDWTLKIGLHKLQMPKTGEEYTYIIDTSIQMSSTKLLVILGVPNKVIVDKFNSGSEINPSHEDVEIIVLKPLESSTGEVVRDCLLEAEEKTGTPISIISDQGGDMTRGVRLFNEMGRNVTHHYDFIHKIDLVVKKEMKRSYTWLKINKDKEDSTQKLKLTSYAHLIPPKRRQKGRMLAELKTIKWCKSIIGYINRGNHPIDLVQKIDWVTKHKRYVNECSEIVSISESAIKSVRENGYYRGMTESFKRQWSSISMSKRAFSFYSKVIDKMYEEEEKTPKGKRFLGSSEVIESIFGKFKYLEKSYSGQGFTSLILGLSAMVGEMSKSIVGMAMENVSTQNIRDWVSTNLGVSFLSRKRQDLKQEVAF